MCMYHLLRQVRMYISAWVRVARSIYWVTRTLRAERQMLSPALFLLCKVVGLQTQEKTMVNKECWWQNVQKNGGREVIFVVWLLVIPMIVLMQAGNCTQDFIMANWVWIVVYLGVMVLLNGLWRKVWLWVSLLVIESPVLVELGWFTMRRVILLKEEFWVIYDTNPQEATGFMSIVPWWTFVVVGVHLLGSIGLAVWVTQGHEKAGKKSWIGMLIFLVFIGISAIPVVRRNVPTVSFYNNYRKYVQEKREKLRKFAFFCEKLHLLYEILSI